MGMGVIVVGVLLLFSYRQIDRLSYPIYLFTLLLLALVAVKGHSVLGAQRWLQLGPLVLQPSEVIKPAIVIALSKYFYARKSQQLMDLRGVFLPCLITLVPAILILKQPDLGTAIIVVIVAGSMILFAGVERKILITTAALFILAVPVAWNFVLHDYQKNRLYTFLNPEKDAKGKGYQTIQSRIAIGSGELFGKGYLNGTQTKLRFLPKQHTDFAFSTFAEEFGFVGSLVVLFLYASLCLLGIQIAQTAKDPFGMYLAFGMTILIGWQAVINLSMEAGILPVVGVPIPLFSYGGTSLLSTLLAIGILMNISMRKYLF
jgi:rod shape determining protein RodA